MSEESGIALENAVNKSTQADDTPDDKTQVSSKPEEIKKAVIHSRISGPKDTPSIFGKKKVAEKKEEESASTSILDKKKEEFSDEDLQNIWKQFSKERESADTDKLIMSRQVKKGEDYDIIIYLSSQLEGSFLDKFDTELIQYLRTELKNDHISLKREVSQVAEVKKLYTSKDIFEHMVKQNPALQDLKDRLGLDFDY